jgi:prevent-host-death family protein
MQTMGAFEAKTHFSSLLERVENGESILITKHGQPVAKLLPVGLSTHDRQESIRKIQLFQTSHQINVDLNWKLLRDEGRR